MNNNEISFVDMLIIKAVSIMKNRDDMEEINELVKLLAVSVFFDKKVTMSEILEAKRIINNEFDSSNDFIVLLLKERIALYMEEFWVYKKDYEYIMKKILIDGDWKYAEFMIDIFKSDGVSKEENEVLSKLINLVENRKILLRELGLN